jgi:BMFP domain-containing protein YqiC
MSVRGHGAGRRWPFAALAVVLFLLALGGCRDGAGELVPEKDERAFRRAISLRNEGRYAIALEQFYDVITKRKVAPESHLEAGLIYLNHLNDPVSAIYHFNRYMSLAPGGEAVARVKGLVNTGLKEIVRGIPPFTDEVERLDVYTRLQSLEEENEQLRQQLARARQDIATWQQRGSQLEASLQQTREQVAGVRAPVAPIVVQERPTRPPGAAQGPRTYTVQAGDTLSSISRQMYGSAGRWAEIFEANRDQLPSQNALRPGQVLRIP